MVRGRSGVIWLHRQDRCGTWTHGQATPATTTTPTNAWKRTRKCMCRLPCAPGTTRSNLRCRQSSPNRACFPRCRSSLTWTDAKRCRADRKYWWWRAVVQTIQAAQHCWRETPTAPASTPRAMTDLALPHTHVMAVNVHTPEFKVARVVRRASVVRQARRVGVDAESVDERVVNDHVHRQLQRGCVGSPGGHADEHPLLVQLQVITAFSFERKTAIAVVTGSYRVWRVARTARQCNSRQACRDETLAVLSSAPDTGERPIRDVQVVVHGVRDICLEFVVGVVLNGVSVNHLPPARAHERRQPREPPTPTQVTKMTSKMSWTQQYNGGGVTTIPHKRTTMTSHITAATA